MNKRNLIILSVASPIIVVATVLFSCYLGIDAGVMFVLLSSTLTLTLLDKPK